MLEGWFQEGIKKVVGVRWLVDLFLRMGCSIADDGIAEKLAAAWLTLLLAHFRKCASHPKPIFSIFIIGNARTSVVALDSLRSVSYHPLNMKKTLAFSFDSSISIAILVTFTVLFSNARAAETGISTNELLAQRLAIVERVNTIRLEQDAVTATIRAKLSGVHNCLFQLSQPPLTDEKIRQMQTDLEACKLRILSLEMQLALANLKDPAVLSTKKTELEAQRDALQAEVQNISEPFQKKQNELWNTLRPNNKAWCASLEKLFRTPQEGKFADVIQEDLRWQSNQECGSIRWTDSTGKEVVYATLFLRTNPREDSGQKLMDGKYRMILWPDAIWVTIGGIRVDLRVSKNEWRGDEKALIELFKSFVDVKGVATLSGIQ